MDVRSVQQIKPEMVHKDTTKLWWLVSPGEMFEASKGGSLELVSEWEVEGGGEVSPHSHPTLEYYYFTSGRGVMVIEDEECEVGPGDLVYIPPNKVHSARPVSEHAPLRALSFAVALPGAGEVDYMNN
jgi:mannose-6-phosphate isomerase-like protein (cupin superfamily)